MKLKRVANTGKSVYVVKSDDGRKSYGVVGRVSEVADMYEGVTHIPRFDGWVFRPVGDSNTLFMYSTRKACLNTTMEAGYIEA